MKQRTVFLSYSRMDADAVGALASDIRDLGYGVWIDSELSGGQAWWDEILRQIRENNVFVFALSPTSLDSVPCVREYEYAGALAKIILPVLIADGVSIALLPQPLAATQFVDYRNNNHRASALKLARALSALPSASPLPDPLPKPPSVPISYLGGLRERIVTTNALGLGDQSALLLELKQALRKDSLPDAQNLLAAFRRRPDLLVTVADELDEMLRAASSHLPPRTPLHAATPPKPVAPARVPATRQAELAPSRYVHGAEEIAESAWPPTSSLDPPDFVNSGLADEPRPSRATRGSKWSIPHPGPLLAVVGVMLVVAVYKARDHEPEVGPASQPESATIEESDLAPVQEDDPPERLKVPVLATQPQRGSPDAEVTIVEFSDFQCPFCARVTPTLEQLEKDYGSKIRRVWRNRPLPFHADARKAATVAMEAFAQGNNFKFWQMHDKLFANARALASSDLEKYATELGLDLSEVRTALENNRYEAQIKQDEALAEQVGARGTPSFFLNGRVLRGAQPIEAFKEIIDDELKRVERLRAKGVAAADVYDTLMQGARAKPAPAPAEPKAADDTVYDVAVPRYVPYKGVFNAKVQIQEFSDFQCPFCARVLPTLTKLEQEYGDKIRIVWRNYPLAFHEHAQLAAEAAVEVYEQGGNSSFWGFHDLLFANQSALSRSDLETYAKRLGGINMSKFRKALDDRIHRGTVKADTEAITKAGAHIGTPSFFINGKLLQGAQPYEVFKAAIDAALSKAR